MYGKVKAHSFGFLEARSYLAQTRSFAFESSEVVVSEFQDLRPCLLLVERLLLNISQIAMKTEDSRRGVVFDGPVLGCCVVSLCED